MFDIIDIKTIRLSVSGQTVSGAEAGRTSGKKEASGLLSMFPSTGIKCKKKTKKTLIPYDKSIIL